MSWLTRLHAALRAAPRLVEYLFIFFTLLGCLILLYFVSNKVAFLGFFYIPILTAAWLLGRTKAGVGAILCTLLMVAYALWRPDDFLLPPTKTNVVLTILLWGGFLLFTAVAIGTIYENLSREHEKRQELMQVLEASNRQLLTAQREILARSNEIQEQHSALEEKTLLIEQLKQKSEDALYSVMNPTVARLLVQGRLRQEKRALSVLFGDLVGFTTQSAGQHPEVLLERLNTLYAGLEDTITSYHGHLDKYIGDAVMCEFGAPVDFTMHALHAVLCAAKLQERIASSDAWQMRIGIASGDCIVGMLGGRRQSYTAIGEVVNLASRIQPMAEPGTIYMDGRTAQAVERFCELKLVKTFTGRRKEDVETRARLEELEKKLEQNTTDVNLLVEVGKLCFQLREASRAIEFFERALALVPDSADIKLLYADASLKRDEFEKFSIRGLQERIPLYELVVVRDPLKKRFPPGFYERLSPLLADLEFQVPENVIQPVEAIEGTLGHARAVALLSYAVAERVDGAGELKRYILLAAQLQDLGKVIVPHHLLSRSGNLSDRELHDIEAHVGESLAIARRMGYDHPRVLEIIEHHHEMLNGGGYPHRRKGDEIPLGARITGVVDKYCALTEWRCYRDAWDPGVALIEMRKGAHQGRYDQQVVEALASVLG